jgi:hypothetical protein
MDDRPDFEAMLERRLRAHAATAVHPVSAHEMATVTMQAASTPVVRMPTFAGPRRPALLVGLAAILLLATVAGLGVVGRRPVVIQGVFVDGPSLPSRQVRSALALPDGRVLIGVDSEESVITGTTILRCPAPCWPHLMLLDPRSGTFTQAARPPAPFSVTSMALLHDGRVLIVSGSVDRVEDRSAGIYDPVADRFDVVEPPLRARTWPFLVTLPDGRVLVGGGDAYLPLAKRWDHMSSAELFDPTTETFSSTGSMAQPRGSGVSATLLPDGRVLVLGGGPEVGTSAELYDPVTGTFALTGPTTVARGGFFTATLLSDERVLIAGGLVPPVTGFPARTERTATAEVYDPATGRFSAVGPMAAPRYLHAASILADGTVLIVGGAHELPPSSLATAASDAEIFDPATGTFRVTGSLLRPRLMPLAVAVEDRVLVLGFLGPFGDDPDTSASTEWFQ